MIATAEDFKVNDTVIFLCDEYRSGHQEFFDGQIIGVYEDNVDVCYLSGYRSRTDFIPYTNIYAKVDKNLPYVNPENIPYSGHLKMFKTGDTK